MNPLGVLHVPHASAAVPVDLRPQNPLTDEALRAELLQMTDWYTDELYSLPAKEAIAIRFPVSRLVVDPERFLDDSREVMSARGMGVIYTRIADGRSLRGVPTLAERQALIARFYDPHHRALTAAVRAALAEHGRCLVVDCHSFPSRPLPCDLDQAADRPDVCLGTDSFHTPGWLLQLATTRLAAAGLTVGIDRPYSGALVPAEHLGRERRVHAIMIEINRRLYMREESGEKLAAFTEVARVAQGLVRAMIAECRAQPPA